MRRSHDEWSLGATMGSRFANIFHNGWSLRPWFMISLIVLPIVGIIVGGITISDVGGANGHHSCVVTSVEEKVNFTWDSTVVFTKTDPQASNEDKFCVIDPAVREKLEQAARSRKRVVLHYENDLVMWRWECNGGTSIIVGVEDEATTSPRPSPPSDGTETAPSTEARRPSTPPPR